MIRLERSVRLGPARRLGRRRLADKPVPLGDEPAGALLGAILDANLGQRAELEAVRDWVRRALRSAKLRDSLDDGGRAALVGRPRAGARRFSRAKHTRRLNHDAIHLHD